MITAILKLRINIDTNSLVRLKYDRNTLVHEVQHEEDKMYGVDKGKLSEEKVIKSVELFSP